MKILVHNFHYAERTYLALVKMSLGVFVCGQKDQVKRRAKSP